MKRPRYSLRLLLLLPVLFAGVIAFASYRSHEQTVLGNDRYKAFYRGLGWTNGSGITGRRYYAFTIDDSPYRTWTISYSGGDYADAVCTYPDGTLAIEGECRIEFTTCEAFPLTDDLRNAKSYSPDGKLTATIADGTGRAMWFYPDGTLNWDMHYRSGERTLLRHFKKDGTLRTEIKNPDSGEPSREPENASCAIWPFETFPRVPGYAYRYRTESSCVPRVCLHKRLLQRSIVRLSFGSCVSGSTIQPP